MTKLNFMNIMNMMMFLIIMILITNYQLHPIFMISLILMYASLACLNMTLWSFNYIYSMLMFLIMISGILILFLYFASLISNEQYKISLKLFSSLLFILTTMMIYKLNFLFQPPHKSLDQLSLMKLKNCPFQSLFKLYDYPYNHMTITCMLFLLMSLLLIIKISSLKFSSLRKIN